MKRGLLVGGHSDYLGKLAEELRAENISLFIAVSLDDVKRIFANESIDIVFLGRESDPEHRLRVLSHIFAVSPASSIHMIGKGNDPLSFVKDMLLRYHPRDPARSSKQ